MLAKALAAAMSPDAGHGASGGGGVAAASQI